VNSIVGLVPSLPVASALWGMSFTADAAAGVTMDPTTGNWNGIPAAYPATTAPQSAFAVGNAAGATAGFSSEKLRAADAIFGSGNVDALFPVTQAARLLNYGNQGVVPGAGAVVVGEPNLVGLAPLTGGSGGNGGGLSIANLATNPNVGGLGIVANGDGPALDKLENIAGKTASQVDLAADITPPAGNSNGQIAPIPFNSIVPDSTNGLGDYRQYLAPQLKVPGGGFFTGPNAGQESQSTVVDQRAQLKAKLYAIVNLTFQPNSNFLSEWWSGFSAGFIAGVTSTVESLKSAAQFVIYTDPWTGIHAYIGNWFVKKFTGYDPLPPPQYITDPLATAKDIWQVLNKTINSILNPSSSDDDPQTVRNIIKLIKDGFLSPDGLLTTRTYQGDKKARLAAVDRFIENASPEEIEFVDAVVSLTPWQQGYLAGSITELIVELGATEGAGLLLKSEVFVGRLLSLIEKIPEITAAQLSALRTAIKDVAVLAKAALSESDLAKTPWRAQLSRLLTEDSGHLDLEGFKLFFDTLYAEVGRPLASGAKISPVTRNYRFIQVLDYLFPNGATDKVRKAFWSLSNFVRGQAIEWDLARTEYKGWAYVGPGLEETYDFVRTGEIAALTTFNPAKGSTDVSRLEKILLKLDEFKGKKILDVRVRTPGQKFLVDEALGQEAKDLKIKLEVSVYP
jgi:hypothetical protein